MRPVRIYLPLQASDLDALRGPAGSVAPGWAYAVTQRLERTHRGADEEELEYVAFSAAVAQAGESRGRAALRRLVAAADVERSLVAEVADASRPALVRLAGPVPVRAVVSFHLDERPGGREELLWYDVTELEAVRALLG